MSNGGTKTFLPYHRTKSVTQSATPYMSAEEHDLIKELSPVHAKLILASQGKSITDDELEDIRNQIQFIQEKYRSGIDARKLDKYIRYTYDLYPPLKPEQQDSSMPFGEPPPVSPKRRKRHGGSRKRTKRMRMRMRTHKKKHA